MSVFRKIRGTIETIFQFGLSGPQIKNNSSVLEAKNSDDSGYVVFRCASPVADNDAATKYYVDAAEKGVIIKRQADCTAALPNNTAVRGFVVVSTAGSGAVIGDILFDDGSSTGTMSIVAATEGRILYVTDALAGGTATFDADSSYIWDADGSSWIKVGDIGSVTGGIRVIRYTIDNSASQDSTNSIPANARILQGDVEVTTPYSGGATIQIGSTSTANLVQSTSDNNPQSANTYSVEQDSAWESSPSVVRTAVGGSPAAGAGVVRVWFAAPLA